MAQRETGTPGRRPVLAGVLLTAAGFFDGLSGLGDLADDRYVVFTRDGLYHLDLTGWAWAHLATGLLLVVGGLLVLSGRRWSVRLAAAAAVVGIVFHLLVIAYEPLWALMVIGLATAVLWLLRRRPRPEDAGGEVSEAGRSVR
ncbi:hypothetical protein ABZ807_07290 [Micromonospora sp. NPDC047548]|uniref:DUF7144 family membrane protein n=1 Tax=Micromonospora sp. NPDC047548 TaxID=3155624 RepID=UPI0033EA9008